MRAVSALLLACIVTCGCSQALVIEEGTLVSDETIVCKNETPIGSRRSQRVCTTAAEREQQRKKAQTTVESEQRARGEPILAQ